jgi:LysM repeat protein
MYKRFLTLHIILFTILLLTVSGRAVSDEWVYSVKRGDTLWSLVSDHLLDISYLEKVQRLNNIANPLDLPTGSKIRIPTKWLKPLSVPVYADAIQGIAELIKKMGGSSALKNGDLVEVGDRVITQKNSSVLLNFIDDSHVIIEENSVLEIETLERPKENNKSKVQLNLKKGRVETHVNPQKKARTQFIIRTPIATTSVRGTRYRVSVKPEDNISYTEVLEGLVRVSNAGESQDIPKDYGTVVLKDTPPKPPIKLLDAPNIKGIPTIFGAFPAQLSLPNLSEKQKYRLQIAKTAAFKGMLFNKVSLSPIIQLPVLSDGTYQVRARRIDSYGLDGKNAQFSIVINTELKAPVLLEAKSNTERADGSITFTWEGSNAKQSYVFQLSNAEDFNQLLVNTRSEGSHVTFNEALKEGKYFWRVATVDDGGVGGFSKPQIFYKKRLAPKVVSVKVIKGELAVDFDKLPSEGTHYQLQIAKSKHFTKLVLDKTLSTSIVKIPILNAGKYYVRARVVESNGQVSSFTDPQSIDVPKKNTWLWIIPFLAVLIFIAIKY